MLPFNLVDVISLSQVLVTSGHNVESSFVEEAITLLKLVISGVIIPVSIFLLLIATTVHVPIEVKSIGSYTLPVRSDAPYQVFIPTAILSDTSIICGKLCLTSILGLPSIIVETVLPSLSTIFSTPPKLTVFPTDNGND